MKNQTENELLILLGAIIFHCTLLFYFIWKYQALFIANKNNLYHFYISVLVEILLLVNVYYIDQTKPKLSTSMGVVLLILGIGLLFLILTPEKTRILIHSDLYFLYIVTSASIFISGISIIFMIILFRIFRK